MREEESQGGFQISTAWRDPEGHHREMDQLRRAVVASGGRIATVDRVDQVRGALSGILRELRGQYVLGYYPTRVQAGAPQPRIEVRLRPKGLDLRAHRGEHGK